MPSRYAQPMPGLRCWTTTFNRGSNSSQRRQIEKVSAEARGDTRRRISCKYPRSFRSRILRVSSIENVSEYTVTTTESRMVSSGTPFFVIWVQLPPGSQRLVSPAADYDFGEVGVAQVLQI